VTRLSIALVIATLVPTFVQAQSPGIPRTADGKPDFSGVWQGEFVVGDRREPLGRLDIAGAAGLEMLPYHPWAADVFKENKAGDGRDDLLARCLPPGVPRIAYVPYPIQLVSTSGQLVALYEGFHQFRVIPTDGRPLPDDPDPAWMGYSSGRWEGDTLVVLVAGLKDKPWFDQIGNFHTEAMKVTERYQRLDGDTLVYEATIDDPKVFTRPWSLKVEYTLRPDFTLLEYNCLEHERDVQHMVAPTQR
jgi:hypothetical protein